MNRKPVVALEGVINACADSECKDWRELAKCELGELYDFHDPMQFDCRGREAELRNELIAIDTAGITRSDVVLVMAERPGWGTAMGVQMAWAMHKIIISVCSSDKPSPWLVDRSDRIFKKLEDALQHIKELATQPVPPWDMKP